MDTKEKELIKAYKKYIHFLGKAYDDVLTLAWVHGYRCSEQEVEFGQRLRDDIKRLENECGVPDESICEDIIDYLY